MGDTSNMGDKNKMSELTRYRKKLTVTIDPDTLNVINAIASNKGAFIDECVKAYLTGEHMGWVTLKYGMIEIVTPSEDGSYNYQVRKFDGDYISPAFSSMKQCLEWIKSECPEVRL